MTRIFPRPVRGEAPPEFGLDANAVKTKPINLTTARITPERIEMGGSILWAVAATSLQALVNVYFNDQMRDPVPFQSGMFVRGVEFPRIYITNAAQPGQTITLLYAVEGLRNIQVENPAASYAQVDLTKATVLDDLADLVLVAIAPAVAILPANAARRAAFITSLDANTAEIRVGALATVAAGRGHPLAAGDTIVLHTAQAIAGYTPGPGNQTVARIWTED